ncbi:hypothetical protein [Idiomarina xiamenensis]|uniref:Uncharacterized protein n=1 Tax=Idiomarina xiamenensis 10-D-4 TaxID=740709 RepID=K2KJK5_9GAMM|nr:hypothetical protein [Idiomarina xiamenensis]EKE82764.1 hypothetical protein A10D4_09169 [Idiomarina xiamenensis 10-D-4]
MAATKPIISVGLNLTNGGQSSLEFLLLLLVDMVLLALLWQLSASMSTIDEALTEKPLSVVESVAKLSVASKDWAIQHQQLQQRLTLLSATE